ncbi:MAG: nuclear transport factor 2 family protein [Acidobacteriota bacterium]|nr:nuclear transport factor 2 family protein [Acidobacteriota bacterium]
MSQYRIVYRIAPIKQLPLIILCVAALSAAPAGGAAGKQEVLAAMDAYKDAMIHKNTAALEKLLGGELTYVHSGGQFETKADVIKGITAGKTIIEKIEFAPDTEVRIYGKIALVRGNVDLWHSATNIVHMNVLHVWEKSPQGWQLVARQATKLTQ